MSFTLYWTSTKLTPDEIPTLVEDEVRKVTVDAASLANGSTISTATATSDTLMVGSVTKSGTTLTFNVTADQLGEHYVTLTATLSDGETAMGYFRVCVAQVPPVQTRDYE